MSQRVQRAYKYRCSPTPAQAAELARTCGCVRLVSNRALQARTTAWSTPQQRVTSAETSAMLTAWKPTDELAFLTEVSSVPLQQSLRQLQGAFVAFWERRARSPRFTSTQRSRASAASTRSAFPDRDGQLSLAKLTEPLPIRWSRPLPVGVEPSTVTVSRDPAGRWFVSLLVAEPIAPLPSASGRVGLDAGLRSLVTRSTGEKVSNPRHERSDRRRLATAQRKLARKQQGSSNRAKARVKVARIHARIADRRRDHLHKLTTRLLRENHTVVIEDLNVRGMTANHPRARAISDAGWTDLRRMLAYKCAWYRRALTVVDRCHPSSTTCSACGHLAGTPSLAVRAWTCQACGTWHDRDVNAAKHSLAAGLAAAACGAGGRPQREPSRTRRSAVKQEPPRAPVGTPAL